jgi:hypothetical protein
LTNHHKELDPIRKKEFEKERIAIKVFFLLPKGIQEKLIHLINNPEAIIQTLLINKKFDIIKTIFLYYPALQSDELITFYAVKAMSLININKKLVENEEASEEFVIIHEGIRNNYNFKSAPDFELFKKFMDLCNDINVISRVCFDVSNSCSKYLLEKKLSQPKVLFINLIAKVLNYLEKRLLKINYNDDRISDYYTKLNFYKKLVDLFKEFIYVKFT